MYNINSYLLKKNAVIIAEKKDQTPQMWMVRKRTLKMVTLYKLENGKLYGKPVTAKIFCTTDKINGIERHIEYVKAAKLNADTCHVDPKGFQPVTEQQKKAYDWTAPPEGIPLSEYIAHLNTLSPDERKKEWELSSKGLNYLR